MEVRWHARFSDFSEDDWNGLRSNDCNPFLGFGFLAGLETTGCLRMELGWVPHHLGVWRDGQLVAAAPGYLKSNSHGEFVFDHAWADAHERYGFDYYPKQVFAIPYSPVTGPRWFARDAAALAVLFDAMRDVTGVSSVHLNFLRPADVATLPGWIIREDTQYHWSAAPEWHTFEDYLAAMDHKHRKNIRRERRLVSDAGIGFRVVEGSQITSNDLEMAYEFYLQTFAEYGNYPALTFEFFQHLQSRDDARLVLILALKDGEAIAGAVCLRSEDTLYGRYWGAMVDVPGLHFETCYYQGIEYCLQHGLRRFEPGAQGVHKIARGFLPTATYSAHQILHSEFRPAIAAWCEQANREVNVHRGLLMERNPYK